MVSDGISICEHRVFNLVYVTSSGKKTKLGDTSCVRIIALKENDSLALPDFILIRIMEPDLFS